MTEKIHTTDDLFKQINDRLAIIGETPDAYFLCQCVETLKQQGQTIDIQAAKIEALEKAAQWIPVSERLPEQGDFVLACIYIPENPFHSICLASMHHGLLYIDPNTKYTQVTHWKPLPKPPIAGEAT